MPPALAALFRIIAMRVGDAAAAAIMSTLLHWARVARDRIADANDSLEDEEAIEAWAQEIDDLIVGGPVVEALSDWLIRRVALRLALRGWDELQDVAVASRAAEQLEAMEAPLSDAAKAVLARREAGLEGRVRRQGEAGGRMPLAPRPARVVLRPVEPGPAEPR